MKHGGNLAEAARRYGIAEANWLDLSTGINPFSYPLGKITPRAWRCLPYATHDLMDAASGYYGVDKTNIALAPGSQALISLLPHLLAEREIEISGPTYSEHEQSWASKGCVIRADADNLLVVNPNNPDGRIFRPEALLAEAKRRKWLIVDEAFVDVVPEISLAAYVKDYPNIIILRSFGKFFGLAGLRLGVVIANPDIVAKAERLFGPWVVSGPALEIATRALNDRTWADKTRKKLKKARISLDACLSSHGLQVIGGCDLFRLVENEKAGDWHDFLCQNAILTRIFAYNSHWLRIGLPAVAKMQQYFFETLGKR